MAHTRPRLTPVLSGVPQGTVLGPLPAFLAYYQRPSWCGHVLQRQTVYRRQHSQQENLQLVRPGTSATGPTASTVWDPDNYKHKDTQLLQKVQQQAARYTCNNFRDKTPGTVQLLLDSLKWNNLEQRRLRNRFQMLHQISRGLVNINLTSFCHHADPRTREAQCLHQKRTNHPILFNFLSCTITDWNHHLTAITSVTSLQSFQNQLGGSLHNLWPANSHSLMPNSL